MTDDTTGSDMEESRLKRIEDKLDKLSEGMSALIRLDERMVTLFKRMDTYDQRAERLSERLAVLERGGNQVASLLPLVDRVTALETINHRRGPMFQWAERLGIALLGALAATAVKVVWGG